MRAHLVRAGRGRLELVCDLNLTSFVTLNLTPLRRPARNQRIQPCAHVRVRCINVGRVAHARRAVRGRGNAKSSEGGERGMHAGESRCASCASKSACSHIARRICLRNRCHCKFLSRRTTSCLGICRAEERASGILKHTLAQWLGYVQVCTF